MKTPYLAHCKLTFTTLRPALCSASLRHLHKSPHGVPRAILVLPLPSDRRDARAVVDGHRSTHRVWVVAALRLPPGQKQLSSSSSAAAASRTVQSLETAARAVGRLQVDTVAVEDSHREPLVAFCPAAADFFGQRRCNRSRSRWRWGWRRRCGVPKRLCPQARLDDGAIALRGDIRVINVLRSRRHTRVSNVDLLSSRRNERD